MKQILLKRLLFIPLGVLAYAATLFAQSNPTWIEQVYSQSVYPLLSSVVGFLPSQVSFSVAEWFVALFLLLCAAYIAFFVHKVIVNKDTRALSVYRGATGAIAIACAVYVAFTALCGLNYYRQSFATAAGYSVEQSSVEDVDRLCTSLASEVEQTRALLGEDTNLYNAQPGSFEASAQEAVSAMQTLAQRYPVLNRPLYSPPKPVLASELMSYANIGGIFFPFTVESNINTGGPFFSIPATMAHELAHQCGFMREDEANFIAYLACKDSDDTLMRYSGLLLAYDHALSALRNVDPERAATIQASLPDAVKQDMTQRAQFWARYEGALSEASTSMNDLYLKANNQTDGVQSYGRMVDLLLAEQRAAAR